MKRSLTDRFTKSGEAQGIINIKWKNENEVCKCLVSFKLKGGFNIAGYQMSQCRSYRLSNEIINGKLARKRVKLDVIWRELYRKANSPKMIQNCSFVTPIFASLNSSASKLRPISQHQVHPFRNTKIVISYPYSPTQKNLSSTQTISPSSYP
jgi:hypothetical protein